MTAIRVAHAGADYEVIVGDLAEAIPRLAEIANGVRLPLITDRRVYKLHGAQLAATSSSEPIFIPEGEAAKDWATLATVVEQLGRAGVKRGTPIMAFGGGSVGDVTGLAASLFKRGCPIVHLPTTLLAQADSAIGGKTAIDAAGQKNLVGTFHHPMLVLADPALLDTLDARQLRSGYAEVVKHGLIDDPIFFAWCEANGARLLAGDANLRRDAILHCVQAKARFVCADPEDRTGARALLNLGHTFGHAIEALAEGSLLHGEAVAIGICLAFAFSEHLQLCPPGPSQQVRGHLASVDLPVTLARAGLAGRHDDLMHLMTRDKKAGREGLTLVLARDIGRSFLQPAVDPALLANFLRRAA